MAANAETTPNTRNTEREYREGSRARIQTQAPTEPRTASATVIAMPVRVSPAYQVWSTRPMHVSTKTTRPNAAARAASSPCIATTVEWATVDGGPVRLSVTRSSYDDQRDRAEP